MKAGYKQRISPWDFQGKSRRQWKIHCHFRRPCHNHRMSGFPYRDLLDGLAGGVCYVEDFRGMKQ